MFNTFCNIPEYALFDDPVHDDFKKLEESHRGVGKTKFLCRLMMHYITENWSNIVMSFKTHNNIENFMRMQLMPALEAHPKLRFRRTGNSEIIVGEPYDVDVSARRFDLSICLVVQEQETYEQMMVHLQHYIMNGYRMILDDSIMVDMRMVRELKILKEPDERLPFYIGHKWAWELLHRDYLERLKNIQSFAPAV